MGALREMSNLGRDLVLAAFVVAVLLSYPASAKSGISVVVLANSIDGELGREFYGFLGTKGLDVVQVSADDFGAYMTEKFVIILGGQNAPDGVGDIVKSVLTEGEQASIVESRSSRKMFVKTNLWVRGQVVRVFAGYGKNETAAAWKAGKDEVASNLTEGSGSSSGRLTCDVFCVKIGYADGVCRLNPGECRNQGAREVYKKRGDDYCRYRTGHKDTCCCVLGK